MNRLLRMIVVLGCLLLGLGADVAYASLQGEVGSNVWGIIASTHQGYVSLFSPPQVDEIYVLADRQHVVSPRRTRVYYWPIDREYKPDWAALNERLEGSLEILDLRGELIGELEKEWYVLIPNLSAEAGESLLIGEESLARYEQYQQNRQEYLDQVQAYDEALQAYLDQKEQGQGDPGQAPERPQAFSDVDIPAPQQAFILNLSPGTYSLRLRDPSGNLVAESERRLHVIEPRREGVGYNVIPEEKWTRPEYSDESDDAIYYSSAGTMLYLQARRTQEFNELAYTRLTEPQNTTASQERWMWIPVEDLLERSLLITDADGFEQEIRADFYTVEQLPGYALGYKVVPFNPEANARPDFMAYQVSLRGDMEQYSIVVLNEAGEPVPGSGRVLVRASESLPLGAWALVLTPIVLGSVFRMLRRRRMQRTMKLVSGGSKLK